IVQNLALGDPVTFATPPSAKYSADLTDGILGSQFDDGAWTGWQGADMDATIDLGQPTQVHAIDARFLQQGEALILLPQSVTFETSSDGQNWTTLQTVPITIDPIDMRTSVREIAWKAPAPVTARYVRVV